MYHDGIILIYYVLDISGKGQGLVLSMYVPTDPYANPRGSIYLFGVC